MSQKLDIDLSNKDTWDDSLLIKGWEDGYKEYKVSMVIIAPIFIEFSNQKYHSLKRDFEEVDENDVNGLKEEEQNVAENDDEIENDSSNVEHNNTRIQEPDGAPVAVTDTASIPLDGLDPQTRQLVMAWYWAGYYHGLRVGKESNNSKQDSV
jgi:hypothetical protein